MKAESVKIPVSTVNKVRAKKAQTEVPIGSFCNKAILRSLELQDPDFQGSLIRFLNRKCKTKADAREVFNYIINQ